MAKKKSAKMSVSLIVILLLVAVGAVCGYFTAQKLTENDKFEIIGERIIEVQVGGTYEDEGAVAVSFGKDLSDKIIVENVVDFNTPGQYYIRYTVDNFRFRGIERYRIINVVEAENEGA